MPCRSSRMKGFYSIVCGVQPVRVVYGDGQVLYLPPLTTVEEVLESYPHHFVCQPGLNSYSSSCGNQMLDVDAELQSGCIYFLLPVPRLFPAAASPSPQSCRCYAHNMSLVAAANEQPTHKSPDLTRSPLKIFSSPQRIGGLGSPFRLPKSRSLKYFLKGSKSKSKVLPESDLYSESRGCAVASAPRPLWRSCPWRPRLGCISEEDDLEMALEELKHHEQRYAGHGV